MASSTASILFNPHPRTPVFYQTAVNTYHLCPACLRAHEARYCSGRTVISHETCKIHEYILTSNSHPLFDPEDLTYFRKALLDGTLTNPFHFQMTFLNNANNILPSSSSTPTLTNTSTRCSTHTPDSFRSALPSPSASTSLKSSSSFSSIAPTTPSLAYPTPLVTYHHDPLTHCLYSPSPSGLIIPPSLIQHLDARKLSLLAHLRAEHKNSDLQHPSIISAHEKILKVVKAGTLAKGVFLKRCNGDFVNAVGDVIDADDAVREGWDDGRNQLVRMFDGRGRELDYSTHHQQQQQEGHLTKNLSRSRNSPNDQRDEKANKHIPRLHPTEPQPQQQQHSSNTNANTNTKIPLPTLLAREALVHSGQLSHEDLILTCWAVHCQSETELESA